ncbi:response regulator transcription factor [Microbacterium aurugineum]|uniref:response regulator transcription factor n=1 Tax=Microbacterium aurugineum TaxID=2851642 RepID=UPI0020BDDFAE|nr:LuxR family transcriptional regulator [Microbacterium aurugineum]MCK8478333.1 LuxR C-terminal-related transcriptional regulator [Microbacterium aurugineum]
MNLTDTDRARDDLAKAVRAGHPETIARIIVANVWPLYTTYPEALTAAVVELPSSLLDRHPILRVLHPMTAVLARRSRSYQPVPHTQDARLMSPDELDFLLLAQMLAFRVNGDVTAAMVYARRLENRLLETAAEGRNRIDGPLWFLHHQIGSTVLAAGDSGRALLEFATARQLGKFSGQPYAERMALSRTALAHAVRGTFSEAERALAEAAEMPEVTALHASATTSSEIIAAALIAVDRRSGDIDELLSGTCPVDAIELNWPFALLARSRAYLSCHRPEDALEAIRLASDGHPTQRGSFAADVVASSTIEALIATGESSYAWALVKENPKVGVLTQLATVHLALYDGRLDTAVVELRALASDQTLGPAQRAETVLLSGWLEFARTGEIDAETARQILRIAQRADRRRLLEVTPRQLVERVRDALDAESAEEFALATADIEFRDLQARPSLTTGELRVLNALPSQRSTATMASTFHVSPNTVKSQLRSIYRKLGCSTREDAIRIATRMRLLAVAASD